MSAGQNSEKGGKDLPITHTKTMGWCVMLYMWSLFKDQPLFLPRVVQPCVLGTYTTARTLHRARDLNSSGCSWKSACASARAPAWRSRSSIHSEQPGTPPCCRPLSSTYAAVTCCCVWWVTVHCKQVMCDDEVRTTCSTTT